MKNALKYCFAMRVFSGDHASMAIKSNITARQVDLTGDPPL